MRRQISILVLVLLVAGCSVGPTPAPTVLVSTQVPTQTAWPTYTPVPTYTPNPTYTPYPTFTPLSTQTALPTATSTMTPMPTPVTHVVRPGDSLNSVAAQYGVSPNVLVDANAIQNVDVITVGQVLVIPSPSSTVSVTIPITVTPKPVVRLALPAPAPTMPPGYMFPAPKAVRPLNGIRLKYDARMRNGGVDTVTFEWTSVGQLENGTKECRWPGLPNGDIGIMWDRYQIEFTPHLISASGREQISHNNDHGLYKTFSLLEFKPDITYSWRVVVVRWCMAKYAVKTTKPGSLGLVSPYSEPSTFSFSF